MNILWPILLTWCCAGCLAHFFLRDAFHDIVVRALRLVPGYREEMNKIHDDPLSPLYALLITLFGWPLLIVMVFLSRRYLDARQGGEDFKLALGRVLAYERIVAEPPMQVLGLPTELACEKKETDALRAFIDVVEPVFLATSMTRALVGPNYEEPRLCLWRRPAQDGARAFSVVARVGLRTMVSTWGEDIRAGRNATVRELRLYFAVDGEPSAVAFYEFCHADCAHCFIRSFGERWRDLEDVPTRSAVAMALLGVVVAISKWNAECPAKRGLFARAAPHSGELSELDVRNALRDNAERLRGPLAQVEDAAANEGPSVVDADGDAPAGVDVGDEQLRSELQRLVRGGEAARVEVLAVGGEIPLEAGAVPARLAGLNDVAGGDVAAVVGRGGRAAGEEQRAKASDGAGDGKGDPGSHQEGA